MKIKYRIGYISENIIRMKHTNKRVKHKVQNEILKKKICRKIDENSPERPREAMYEEK